MKPESLPSLLCERAQAIGIGIAVYYWFMEAFFDAFLFNKGPLLDRLLFADSNELWMRTLIVALIIAFSSYVQSSHRQKQAEAEAGEKEALFSDILHLSGDGILVVDASQRILLFNQGAEVIFGYSAEEVLRRSLEILLPEGLAEQHGRHLAAFGAEAETSRKMGTRLRTLRARRKNGTVFPADISISKLEQHGEILFSAVVRDVTEQKRAEAAIKRLNQELEQRVIERTAQLTEANKELESFCYSVSHDLRAPLRGITGFSEALKEDYADKLDARGLDYLQRTSDAGKRMGELIDELLTLSRVTREAMHIEVLDLSGMAREIASELEKSQPARKVKWRLQEGVRAEGDRPLIRSVLQNLLENAWKFTGKTAETEIAFGRTSHRGKSAYFVRDNGAGFDMAYADKLFGPFQRLHRQSDFPGNGIGLATVQRIVHRHSGQVWAEGALDKGAAFYFSLPRGASQNPERKEDV